jgi:hypothetical protein
MLQSGDQAYRSTGEIEASGAGCEIRYNHDGEDREYRATDSIEQLNEYHQNRITDECERDSPDDRDRKSDQHRLASEDL